MELSVIIVNWNSRDFLRKCLSSIYKYTEQVEYEIIVIDNGSYDGCDEMLVGEFPGVIFIQGENNRGFAGANNVAAKRASGRMLLFMNPDVEVHSSAICALCSAARMREDSGAIVPRILNSDGTVQFSCVQAFPTILNQFLDSDWLRRCLPNSKLWGNEALYAGLVEVSKAEGVSGACLLTPRAVFTQLGGFSERYFMYFEDMDYCNRAFAGGYRNYYVPSSVVTHHGGKASGGEFSRFACVMSVVSAEQYFETNRGRFAARLFRLATLTKSLLRLLLLVLALPLAMIPSLRRRILAALRKWAYILHWALGGQRWALDYHPPRKHPAPSEPVA